MRTTHLFIAVVAMLGFAACSDDTVTPPSPDKPKTTDGGVTPGKEASAPGKEASAPVAKTCQCAEDSDCTAITGGTLKFCVGTTIKTCVQCKQNTDCAETFKGGCDTTTGTCLTCGANADCTKGPGNTGKCLTTGILKGQCMMCESNGDCTESLLGKACNTTTHRCVPCATNTDCTTPATLGTGKCDTASGQCLNCDTNTECEFNLSITKICDTANHVCIGCNANADCAEAAFKECDTTAHTCSICTANAECTAVFPGGTALTCK